MRQPALTRLTHLAWLGLIVFANGCMAPAFSSYDSSTGTAVSPTLNASGILAPTRGSRDLRALDGLDSDAAKLRRAHILTETGAARRAVTELNRLLFGSQAPSTSTKAWALYLRSRAYGKQGDTQRARFDREGAHAVAIEAGLRDLIDRTGSKPAVAPRPAVASRGLVVLARGSWRADPPIDTRMKAMGKITRLTIHHSGALARQGRRYAAAAIHGIQRHHQQQRGWGDIGYHFLIDRDGAVWTGRPLRYQGAHAGDSQRNRGNVGICLLGSFVAGRDGQAVSPAQRTALERLIQSLCRDHGIPGGRIYTHRELRSTECPGDRLQAIVASLRSRL